eukprot:6187287-Prorocentrum_lima.AAC.1
MDDAGGAAACAGWSLPGAWARGGGCRRCAVAHADSRDEGGAMRWRACAPVESSVPRTARRWRAAEGMARGHA